MEYRIGHGYDVHRLVKDRPLIIGGVEIPYPLGLDGHSDADVLLHAVIDSVFGALALGDIGKHFPPSNPFYDGINSLYLLSECCKKMNALGYRLGNLDATLVAQSPKLAPYLPDMRKNISGIFRCQLQQVNIKATTEEGLGFTGNGDGISAHCVCILRQK